MATQPMSWMRKALWIGIPAVIVLAAGGVIARYAILLEGQAPTAERIFSTPTGGTPHYEPIQYRAKDSRPAIMEPQFVEAATAQLVGGTMGIGVAVGGESRFYPLLVMQYHQVVNDTCGGKPVACSF